jgi:hypothetical protein
MPLDRRLDGIPGRAIHGGAARRSVDGPGVRARFKTTPIVFEGGETTLFDFVGGERFFSLLAEGQVNLAAAQLSLGSLAGNFFARTSFTIVDSNRKALAHFSGAFEAKDRSYERRLSPELKHLAVRNAIAPVLGRILGLSNITDAASLEQNLRQNPAFINRIGSAKVVGEDGMERTLSGVFGDEFFNAVKNGRLDWAESNMSIGFNGKNDAVADFSLALRDAGGALLGHLTGSLDATTGRLSVAISPNLKNEQVRAMVVPGLAAVFGLGTVRSPAELDAALKATGRLSELANAKITIGEQSVSFRELFGQGAFDAIAQGRLDWDASSLSFGFNASGDVNVSVALAVRSANGDLIAYHSAGVDTKTRKFTSGVTPNLQNLTVRNALANGMARLLGVGSASSAAELENKLKDPSVRQRLQSATIEVPGQGRQTLRAVFGGAFFDAMADGHINWEESRLSFGYDGDGRPTVDISLAVEGRDGLIIGRHVAYVESSTGLLSRGVSPELSTKRVMNMVAAGLAKILGLSGVTNAAQLKANLENPAFIAQLKQKVLADIGDAQTREIVNAVLGVFMSGGKISWNHSSLTFGTSGNGQPMFNVSIAVLGTNGRVRGHIQMSWDAEKGGFSTTASIQAREIAGLFTGNYSAGAILGRALASYNSALFSFLQGGSLDLNDGTVSVGLGADGKAVVNVDVAYRDAQGRSMGRLGINWDGEDKTLNTYWSGDLERGAMLNAIQSLLGYNPLSANPDGVVSAMNLPDAKAGQLAAAMRGAVFDFSRSKVTIGTTSAGDRIFQINADIIQSGKKIGEFSIGWDKEKKGFNQFMRFEGVLPPALANIFGANNIWAQLNEVTVLGTGDGISVNASQVLNSAGAHVATNSGTITIGLDGGREAVMVASFDVVRNDVGQEIGSFAISWDVKGSGFSRQMELDYGKMTAGERAAVINLFESAIASNSQSTIGRFSRSADQAAADEQATGARQVYNYGVFGWSDMGWGGVENYIDNTPYTLDQAINSAMEEPRLVQTAGYSWGGEYDYFNYWNSWNQEPTYNGFYGMVGEYKGFLFGYGEFGWGCFGTDRAAWSTAQATYAPQTGHMGQSYSWASGWTTGWQVTNAGAAKTANFNASTSRVFRYDKYQGSAEQRWASLGGSNKNSLPFGTVDTTTGKLQMGRTATGEFYLRETQNVRSGGDVVGEYIRGISGSGESVRADSYVSYKLTHASVQSAIASGVLPRFGANAPEVGQLDWNSGRLNMGIQGGDRIARVVYDIIDPYTGEVMGQRVDGLTFPTETVVEHGATVERLATYADHYSTYDLSKESVQRYISVGALNLPYSEAGLDAWTQIGVEKKNDGTLTIGTQSGKYNYYVNRSIFDDKGNKIGTHVFGTVGGKSHNTRTYDLAKGYVQQAVRDGRLPMPSMSGALGGIDVNAKPLGTNIEGEYVVGVVNNQFQWTVSWDVKNSSGHAVLHYERGYREGHGRFATDQVIHSVDGKGRVLSDTETRWNEGNGYSVNTRNNIVYDGAGRVYSYSGSVSQNGGPAAYLTVHWMRYDNKGREIGRHMTVSWSGSHYGLLGGLTDGAEGWRNGSATVTVVKNYDADGQLSYQSISGTVHSASNSQLAQYEGYRSSFGFSYTQYNMHYDAFGRLTSSTYVKNSPSTTQVSDGKKSKTVVANITTSGSTRNSNFDAFGRAQETYSDYSNSDGSHGWTHTTNIVFNEYGNVVSQTERYHSYQPPVGKGGSQTTDGLRTVTYDYDGNNQLTKRNENKVWEDTKVSGGGGSAGGFLGIIIAVVIIVVAVYIAAAVVAAYSGATISSVMSSFMTSLTTTGSFAAAIGTMGTVGLVAFVGAVFVLNFAVAYMMTGNLEYALIQGAIAAISAYFMATAGPGTGAAGGAAGGGATQTAGSVLSSVVKTIAGDNVLAQWAVKEIIMRGINVIVTDLFNRFAPNLTYLSSMVSGAITAGLSGGPAGGDWTKMLANAAARVAINKVVSNALGDKYGWMTAFVSSFLSYDWDNGFSFNTSGRSMFAGLMNSLATRLVQKMHKEFGYLMSTPSGNGKGSHLTAAGQMMTDAIYDVADKIGTRVGMALFGTPLDEWRDANNRMIAEKQSLESFIQMPSIKGLWEGLSQEGKMAVIEEFQKQGDNRNAATALGNVLKNGDDKMFLQNDTGPRINNFTDMLLNSGPNLAGLLGLTTDLMGSTWLGSIDKLAASRLQILTVNNPELSAQDRANLMLLSPDQLSKIDLAKVRDVYAGFANGKMLVMVDILGSGIKDPKFAKFVDNVGLQNDMLRVIFDLDTGKMGLDVTRVFANITKDNVAKFTKALQSAFVDIMGNEAAWNNIKGVVEALSKDLVGAEVTKFVIWEDSVTVEFSQSFDALSNAAIKTLAGNLGYGAGDRVDFRISEKGAFVVGKTQSFNDVAGMDALKESTKKMAANGQAMVASFATAFTGVKGSMELQWALALGGNGETVYQVRGGEELSISGASLGMLTDAAAGGLGGLRGIDGGGIKVSATLGLDDNNQAKSVGAVQMTLTQEQSRELNAKIKNKELDETKLPKKLVDLLDNLIKQDLLNKAENLNLRSEQTANGPSISLTMTVKAGSLSSNQIKQMKALGIKEDNGSYTFAARVNKSGVGTEMLPVLTANELSTVGRIVDLTIDNRQFKVRVAEGRVPGEMVVLSVISGQLGSSDYVKGGENVKVLPAMLFQTKDGTVHVMAVRVEGTSYQIGEDASVRYSGAVAYNVWSGTVLALDESAVRVREIRSDTGAVIAVTEGAVI